jgi:hypothetical protein
MFEPMFKKFGFYIMAPESISMVYSSGLQPGVREDILGGTWKQFTRQLKLEKKYSVINVIHLNFI